MSAALWRGLVVSVAAAVWCLLLLLLLVWLVLVLCVVVSVMQILVSALCLYSIFLSDPFLSLPEVGRILVSVSLAGQLLAPVLFDVYVFPLHVPVGVCPEFPFSALARAHAFPRPPSAFSALFRVEGVSPTSAPRVNFHVVLSVPVPVPSSLRRAIWGGFLCLLTWFDPVVLRLPLPRLLPS